MITYYLCSKHVVPLGAIKRSFSAKKTGKSKKYSNTINLPSSEFPLWVNPKERSKTDEYIEAKCGLSKQYMWQRENVTGPEFILHDGPPYANGSVHMGHAINKILKDITLRHKAINGYRVNYIPGWDCHGLPIENRVLNVKKHWTDMSPLDIRKRAREFVESTIEEQKRVFKMWGILADWDSSCYYTYDKDYAKNQLRQFLKLYDMGLVYRDLKPVYWSPSSRTALAEAELEYNENHVSKSVIFRVKLNVSTVSMNVNVEGSSDLYALVWTTTPWTIPANEAIAFNENTSYSLIQAADVPHTYLVASDAVKRMEKLMKKEMRVLSTIPGSVLSVVQYAHPLDKDVCKPFVVGTHVVTNKGTGLVHIAPGHGPEDFLLGLRYKLPIKSIVDEKGCFVGDVGHGLSGIDIMKDANDKIMEMLNADVMYTEDLIHSYPYDWRTKKPIVIRASEQWFFDTDTVKDEALEALKRVKILPQYGGQRLESQVKKRPYWCISRQRSWGIPIPALYDTASNGCLINRDLIEHYCTLIDQYGMDFWWELSTSELIPKNLRSDPAYRNLRKGTDIFDIWLDSGLSWSYVLPENQAADVYIEGVDQCTGWFQASLITSVALRHMSPFRSLFVHGFAVDEKGKKMSKSQGNAIDPEHVLKGIAKKPPSGIDVFRWWVATYAPQNSQVYVADNMFKLCKEYVQEVRKIMKFLLGVLSDYVPPSSSSSAAMIPTYSLCMLDRYMLHQLHQFHSKIEEMYENYEYNSVCWKILSFISNTISACYCHLIKDRLYCEGKNSELRRASQQTAYLTLEVLLKVISPITPHLVEEVYIYHPLHKGQSYFKSNRIKPDSNWYQPELVAGVDRLLELKQRVVQMKPVDIRKVKIHVIADLSTYEILQTFRPYELTELFQTSAVTCEKSTDESQQGSVITVDETPFVECLRCRRYTCNEGEELCERCLQVVKCDVAYKSTC